MHGDSVSGCECAHCKCVVFVTGPGIRLVGGSGPHEGRVEVYHNGTWGGTVCDDDWDLQDATVVCRQAGYINATAAVGPARFGSGSGPIVFSEVSCVGNESTITECDHRSTGGHNCSHKEDVGVVCEGQSVCSCGEHAFVSVCMHTVTQAHHTILLNICTVLHFLDLLLFLSVRLMCLTYALVQRCLYQISNIARTALPYIWPLFLLYFPTQ